MSEETTASTEIELVEEAPAPLPDYDNIVVEKGQYWVRGNDVVAFVLDCNESAVLFQNLINPAAEDTSVFDFGAGQEVFSLPRFRALLKEESARIFTKASPTLVKLALETYNSMFVGGDIPDAVSLPRTKEEIEDFLEYEEFEVISKIIPPPREYRNIDGIHWFKTGVSHAMYAMKLWSAEKRNWINPDGTLDVTAKIGFLKGYHKLAIILGSKESTEVRGHLINRIVDMLRKKEFFFDEKFIRAEFDKINQIAYINEAEQKIPNFHLSACVKKVSVGDRPMVHGLSVFFEYQGSVAYEWIFPELQNKEFISNAPTKFEVYG